MNHNLTSIPDAELERFANAPTQADFQAELARRQQQQQVIAETGHYQAQAGALNERLDQLVGEYQTRYQSLAEALATNPESKLVPELADLYRLTQFIEELIRQFVLCSLYAGLITDPLITDRLGKPVRGRTEIDRWINTSGDLGRQILANQVTDELERRTSRKVLYAFPEPFDSRLVYAQKELLATAVLVATGKR